MSGVIFELRGTLGHFRRPDTLATFATYPFIPRTALRGLVASVLGRTDLPTEVRCGVQLLAPVRTVAQQTTMHGKRWFKESEKDTTFHRPQTIELVVNPHYRICYSGPFAEELSVLLKERRSHFHTYLGSAYCLTFPRWIDELNDEDAVVPVLDEPMTCASVVPSAAVERLLPQEQAEYARVGGMLREHVGDMGERRFEGSVSVLYEVGGGPLRFLPTPVGPAVSWRFCRTREGETVCLW